MSFSASSFGLPIVADASWKPAGSEDPGIRILGLLLATIGLLTPAIARLPGIAEAGPLAFFALTDLFIAAGFVYDRWTRRRVHPAFLWGGLFIIVSQPLRLVASSTGAWLAFANWLTG